MLNWLYLDAMVIDFIKVYMTIMVSSDVWDGNIIMYDTYIYMMWKINYLPWVIGLH